VPVAIPCHGPRKRPCFEDFLAQFITWYRVDHALRSIARYKDAGKALIGYFRGSRLSNLDPEVIEDYKRQRQALGRGPVTINKELTMLRQMFGRAIAWGKLRAHPMGEVAKLEELERTRVLSDAEEQRLLRACNPRLRALVIAALDTSFRKSELLALTWRDIDWRRGTSTVQAAYVKGRETMTMPMTERLTALLNGLTVPSDDAGSFGYRSVNKSFRRLANRVGLPDVCYHDRRHTIGTRLVQDGLDVGQVRSVLGHKTIKMPMRYTHLDGRGKRQAVDVLNRQNRERNVTFSATDELSRSGGRAELSVN
jgi:integrase